MTMFFGSNQNHYTEMVANVSGMTMVRSYKSLSPTWPVMPDNLPALLSIRPDPAGLLAGQFDSELRTMINSAPLNSLLTTWHEPNQVGSSLTAAQARAMHVYMMTFIKGIGSPVKYGSILTQGASATWTLPGLDWYGVDLYDVHTTTDPGLKLDTFFSTMPKGCKKIVAETNSSLDYHRPAWFREVYDWLYRNNGIALLTFWNPTGPLSGPWLDTDAATIYALRGISRDAQRP